MLHVSEPFVESGSFLAHSSPGCKNSLLNLSGPLSVLPLFRPLVSPVGVSGTVTRWVRVENLDIEKCILVVVPEASCTNIRASTVVGIH